jgi:hypothetical protein
MQTIQTIIGSMIDESESGEAYDKLANQQQRLAPRKSQPAKRGAPLSIELEARLVRAAMSNTLTLNRLASKLGIKPSSAAAYLKQLGLEKMVLKDRAVENRTAHRPRRTRKTLTH